MTTPKQTDINKIKLNVMTQEQYNSAQISDNEFYVVTDAPSGNFSTAMLSYPTGGQALSDTTLYNYIKGMWDESSTTGYYGFDKVGEPIIDSNFVAIFSKGNYIAYSIPVILSDASTWEIDLKFNMNNINSTATVFSGTSLSRALIGIGINSSRQITLALGDGSSSWISNNTGTTILDNTTDYIIKLKYTGASYQLLINNNLEIEVERSSNINFIKGDKLFFGTNRDVADSYPIKMYLKDFHVYADGTLVSPLFYKIIKSGSRVADVQYNSVVENIYNEQGYALYYVIDTENHTVTLPRGDIFGFITQALGL